MWQLCWTLLFLPLVKLNGALLCFTSAGTLADNQRWPLPCPGLTPFLSFIFLIFSLLSDRDQDLHSRQDFEIPHHQVNWKQVTGAPSEGRHILPIFRWLQTISPSLAERAMAVWPSPDWAPHLPRDCQPLLPHISFLTISCYKYQACQSDGISVDVITNIALRAGVTLSEQLFNLTTSQGDISDSLPPNIQFLCLSSEWRWISPHLNQSDRPSDNSGLSSTCRQLGDILLQRRGLSNISPQNTIPGRCCQWQNLLPPSTTWLAICRTII